MRVRTPPPSTPLLLTPPSHITHTHSARALDDWDPVVTEDEELNVAIAMSLQQEVDRGSGMMSLQQEVDRGSGMMDIVGPQVVDSNKLVESGEGLWSLPPELQHLLQQERHRAGEHV